MMHFTRERERERVEAPSKNTNKKCRHVEVYLVVFFCTLLFTSPLVASAYFFQKPIDFGSRNDDVVALQSILKENWFYAHPEITGYFGLLTQQAVEAFQKAKGIVSNGTPQTTGYGRVGPQTINALNILEAASTTTATPINLFVRDLKLGMRGDDVKALQQFLNTNGFQVAVTGL